MSKIQPIRFDAFAFAKGITLRNSWMSWLLSARPHGAQSRQASTASSYMGRTGS